MVRAFFLLSALIVVFALSTNGTLAEDAAKPPPSESFIQAQSPDIDPEKLDLYLIPFSEPELAELADIWQLNLKKNLELANEKFLLLSKAPEADENKIRLELVDYANAQNQISDNYKAVLAAWTTKGGDPAVIDLHEKYILAVTKETLKATDAITLIKLVKDWLFSKEGGLGVLYGLLMFSFAVVILIFVARFVRGITARWIKKISSISVLLQTFALGVVYWLTFAVGLMFVLAMIGVNITPLFAVFGGLSFILGFALQDTLGNLASGLMIMVLKPYDLGDYVETAGASGYVHEMSIVSTTIRTFDNQMITVPNSKIWGDVITNVSAADTRRVDMVLGIAYSDNADHAIKVLQGLVAKHEMCLSDPEPEVFVGELGDSSVNIFCRPWVKTDDYWVVYWDIIGQAKEAFDAEGISIPFPQRDVHLIPQPAAD